MPGSASPPARLARFPIVALALGVLAAALWIVVQGSRGGRGEDTGTRAAGPLPVPAERTSTSLFEGTRPGTRTSERPSPGVQEMPLPTAPPVTPATRAITGRLLRASRAPATGTLEVEAYAGSGPAVASFELTLDSEGRFRTPGRPAQEGTRRFDPTSWTGIRLRLRGRETPFDRWFELRAPGDVDLGVLVLAHGGALEGRLRGLARFEGWTWNVLVREEGLPPFLSRRSLPGGSVPEDGRLRIEHVPAGETVLAFGHPLLGSEAVVLTLAVHDGETTTFEATWTGPDPARALVVEVDSLRAPRAGEIWIRSWNEVRIAPASLNGRRALFADLDENEYTATLHLEEGTPVEKGGLRRGAIERIEEPAWTARMEEQRKEAERQSGEARIRVQRSRR